VMQTLMLAHGGHCHRCWKEQTSQRLQDHGSELSPEFCPVMG